MPVSFAPVQVFFPYKPVVRHPAERLEHALGQNDLHLVHGMTVSPCVNEIGNVQLLKQRMKIDLVQNALDIRHADLERGVDRL